MEHSLSSLHVIHKSLLFWQSLAEVSVTYDVCYDYLMSCQLCVVHVECVPEVFELVLLLQGTKTQKVCFMIFRRGPKALVNETCKMLSTLRTSGSPIPHVYHSAAETISQRISILTSLQCCLANFLAEVCAILCTCNSCCINAILFCLARLLLLHGYLNMHVTFI